MKICKTCGIAKDLDDFKKNAKCRDGVTGKCKSCTNAYLNKWRQDNPNHSKGNRSEVSARYYEKNKERILQYTANYRKENLSQYAHYASVRHTRQLDAMPDWLTEEQVREIKSFYERAALMQEPTHVDHIVPLQGKNVCGLHVPWNLQLLPAIENIRKGNKF